MIDQLFGSKTRVKLLKMFMTNPNRSFYVREITRKIDEQINSVRRELGNLLSIGIISSDSSNNRLYYEVDQKYEHYDALTSLFGGKKFVAVEIEKKPAKAKSTKVDTADKTVEPKAKKAKTVKKPSVLPSGEEKMLGNVELVLLGGIFTRSKDAPVDLLIVGNVTQKGLENYVAEQEKTVGEEISYALFTAEEFKYRRQIKDKFITNMLSSKLTVKVDKNGLLEEIK